MKLISEKELWTLNGRAQTQGLTSLESEQIFRLLEKFITMMDDADQYDSFGTEGWRHVMGSGWEK